MLRSTKAAAYGKKLAKKKVKRTSMTRVSYTGEPAPSWIIAPDLAEVANRCFRACLNPHAAPDLIRVYWNNPQSCYGRCFIEHRLITIGMKQRSTQETLHTLAHEIAHLRYRGHGPKHEKLTKELFDWIMSYTDPAATYLPAKPEKVSRQKKDILTLRYNLVLEKESRWASKLKRAENALKKLRQQRSYYEKRIAARSKEADSE
jgi:hypothetical protein